MNNIIVFHHKFKKKHSRASLPPLLFSNKPRKEANLVPDASATYVARQQRQPQVKEQRMAEYYDPYYYDPKVSKQVIVD